MLKRGSLVLAACVALLSAVPAKAAIMIVSSDAAELKAGVELADSAAIDIPSGAKVRIMLPSGKTKLLTGPMKGTVADLVKGEPLAEGVWNKAKEFLQTGGVDQGQKGATRSVFGGGNAKFSWSVIAPATTGDVCIEQGASLTLARAFTSTATEAEIIDGATNARARVAWAAGAAEAPWPAALAPKVGTVYEVIPREGQRRQIRLRFIDKAMTDDENALLALIEQGCRDQVRLWIRQK
jgi:hypothetical protein